jgi:aspartokinase
MEEESKTLEIIRRVGAPKPEKITITGILKSPDLALLNLTLPADNDSPATVLSLLGAHGVNIRFITLYEDPRETRQLTLCVEAESLPASLEILQSHQTALGIRDLSSHRPVRIISIYPYKERAPVTERLLTSLRLSGIEPLAVNNATSVLSCVLDSERLQEALTCLEHVFALP